MNQKDIDAALEDADMEPMTYENPNGSTKAERTLAAAYRELQAENQRLLKRDELADAVADIARRATGGVWVSDELTTALAEYENESTE